MGFDDMIWACHVVGDEDEYTVVLDAEESNLGWEDGHWSTPLLYGVVTDRKSLCPPLMTKSAIRRTRHTKMCCPEQPAPADQAGKFARAWERAERAPPGSWGKLWQSEDDGAQR